MYLYFVQIWELKEPEKIPAAPGKAVDVLLPTFNEDAELLRGSIVALTKLDYPHKTYVLDDGNRPEIKALAEELGVNYIAREDNLFNKAGNLNNALDQTDGEFVVILDADHIAKTDFISRTLGYFEDEKMAFVQTPHAFYNFENFQGNVNYKKGTYWEEGQLFYNVIQPGKTHWNANVFCGSAAIFRRTALEDVGLIATETITEDIQTGLRMHARGWKSTYVNERLIAAQAAPDITTFTSQRLRWGEGNLSLMAYDNPLTVRGLTLGQRLNYMGSILGWTTGLGKVALYLTPILMLFTGVAPVGKFTWLLGAITAAYLISVWAAVKVASNGVGRLWNIEVQAMANFWLQCIAVFRAIVRRGRGKFVVTQKRGTQTATGIQWVYPHFALIALGVSAICWSSGKILLGVSNDYIGLIVGSLLIFLQSLLAFKVIRKALKPSEQRFSWRHPAFNLHVAIEGTGKFENLKGQGLALDVNENGLGMIMYRPV
ncbi:MAG: glycosyltransferase, partial [Planctomycetota bacterium]|nr:glycosyltransferase [Planctomycetota bacterium]